MARQKCDTVVGNPVKKITSIVPAGHLCYELTVTATNITVEMNGSLITIDSRS